MQPSTNYSAEHNVQTNDTAVKTALEKLAWIHTESD